LPTKISDEYFHPIFGMGRGFLKLLMVNTLSPKQMLILLINEPGQQLISMKNGLKTGKWQSIC
jgi:hypothetical protein